MTLTFAGVTGSRNAVLAVVPPEDAPGLQRLFRPVSLVRGMILLNAGQVIEELVFPESGAVSMIAEYGGGERAEVSIIGREGVVGLEGLVPGGRASFRAMVQMDGQGCAVPAAALRAFAAGSPALGDGILRAALLLGTQAAISAGCAAVHPLRQRLARWLLLMHDRGGSGFFMTQELLGIMLAASRPTVNGLLRDMAAAGLVRTARNYIAIADQKGLEAATCECRARLRAAEAQLLAAPCGAGIHAVAD